LSDAQEPSTAVDREYWARILHDAWPHTVISEALSKATGLPIGTVLTWDAVKAAGADCSGLYRFADAIVAALQSSPHVADMARLRAALIEAGRNAGCLLSDDVSTDFLMHVPEEIRLKLAGAGRTAICDIAAERQRQISAEGWTPEHDDEHRDDLALARAAACYALAGTGGNGPFWITHLQTPQQVWPYRWEWKPKDRRANLVRAGALIVAEIERVDRATPGASDAALEESAGA
jgi:hypothetical protein